MSPVNSWWPILSRAQRRHVASTGCLAEPEQRAAQLAELQVETLICGAISQGLEALLSENGIKVYGRICGNADEVLKAFAAGTLGDAQYAMPGCCGQQRRQFRGGCQHGRRSRKF